MQEQSQYYLSNLPSRQQIAKHFQSSLAQPNLENVQAQLYATRQRNHQLAMEYFRNKYGSTDQYQPYAALYRQSGVKEKNDFEEQLKRKAEEIRRKQMQKIRRKGLGIQIQQQQQQQIQKNNKKPKRKDNPWLQKPTDTHKQDKNIQNIDKKSQKKQQISNRIHIDSLNNNKQYQQDQFITGFKNYLTNKSTKPIKKQYLNENKNNSMKQNQQKIQKNKIIYQQQLVKKLFKDINHQNNPTIKSSINKIQLIQYLVNNKRILNVLGINQSQLNQQLLQNYSTKNIDNITYKQLVLFLLKILKKQQQSKYFNKNWQQTIIPKGCMLKQDIINIFETIFKKMDKHSDLIVPRIQFISQLANDPKIRKILNLPAVHQPQINRSVSLRRIFQRIQLQCIFGNQQQQRIKQYISWQQFISYLGSRDNNKSKYDLMVLVDSLRKQQKIGLNQLPDIIADIIHRAFQKNNTGAQYFNTLKLIQTIKQDPYYQDQKYTLVRQQNKQTNLPSQILQDILTRILQSSYKYLNAKQFLQYFSIRGKPRQQFQINQNLLLKKSFSGVKVKFIQDNISKQKQQQQINGYDSDPQMYNNSQIIPKKSGRKNKKQFQTEKSKNFQQQSLNLKYQNNNKKQSKEYKITVPIPFKFEQRQKQKQQKKSRINQSVDSKSQSHFKARQIPKTVLEVGLYNKMIQDDLKRQQQRKRNSMIMTLANQNPFNFQKRKTNKKTKQQRQKFVFQAKPIPWYCSVDLLKKKKQSEIQRNQKIAKKAQQNLAKAKLPPRMEKDFQEKQAKKMIEKQKIQTQQQKQRIFRAKQPPNFQQLHSAFEKSLQKKRKQNKKTQIKQFNFSEIKKRQKKFIQATSVKIFIIPQKERATSLIRNQEHMIPAATTAKYTQQVQKRRKQIQEKRKKQQQLKQQDKKRQQIDEQLRKKLNALAKGKKNKQEQQLEKRKQTLKKQQKQYFQRKQKLIEKARQQPLLVQRPLKRDQKIQKMKKLYQISQTLKNNGIKGKDHDFYFKKDQRIMLQDYQVLKDRL